MRNMFGMYSSPLLATKKCRVLTYLIIIAASVPVGAFQWKDSGWITHGKTVAQQEFLRRDVEIRLIDGTKTGFSYVHKKGRPTRDTKNPTLSLGYLTYHQNWSSYSLFDLTVNNERNYIAKHITEVPEFEFL